MIPFVDLSAQLHSLRAEIDGAIDGVLRKSDYISGSAVTEFEQAFCETNDVRFTVGVGSGTEALCLAVKALELGPGDEVITVANTWISTAFAASHAGAKVVFVDVDPDTYQIDPEKLTAAITPQTKAVIPVHLFGHPAPVDKIVDICQSHSLKLIEDVAQSPLATVNGKKVGTFGDVACYSFYPSKNLGCFGDGGAVVTDNEELAIKVRQLANYGQLQKYNHSVVGWNSRLDTLQAAILSVKLPYLNEWNSFRRRAAQQYSSALESLPIKIPMEAIGAKSVFHLYVIQIDSRDECMEYLGNREISTQVHFPNPIHLQKCYSYLGYRPGDLPVTELAASRILSLPIFPELSESQIFQVVDALNEFIQERR